MSLPTFIPLVDAAEKYGISVRELRRLAESGKITAATLPDGDVIVSEDEVKRPLKKEDLPEYKKYAHLRGHGIGIAEAARKYQMSISTIHKWKNKGYISTLGYNGQKILLDEQDVAYCVHVYRNKNIRAGKRVFNSNGTPFVPKSKMK